VPGVFGHQQANHFDLSKQMLYQSMHDTANYEVIYMFILLLKDIQFALKLRKKCFSFVKIEVFAV